MNMKTPLMRVSYVLQRILGRGRWHVGLGDSRVEEQWSASESVNDEEAGHDTEDLDAVDDDLQRVRHDPESARHQPTERDTHGDDEGVAETDEGEERGRVREDELHARDLLRDENTDRGEKFPSLDRVT
jgi:hypothetical protein